MLRLSSQTQQSRVRAQLELLLRNAEPGERLPSEPALAKRFDVSRTTIREVMSQLETEGFVQRRQGSGTYVRHQPLLEDESLLHFVDFPTLISKQGHTPAMRQLGFVQQRAGAFFSTRFHIGEEDRILTRRCLYTADEHFCVLAEDSFPLAFLSKVSGYSCLGQTIPICGFSFFSQPAAPPVRTKPQSPLPNRKTTRSLNPCSRTSSIRCSF
ncbi:MAG: GntR family transcriptional regulator [Oscillospiraceae bacterium]